MVILAIDKELILGLKKNILKILCRALEVTGSRAHEVCRELLQESSSISHKRAELKKMIERLTNANKELVSI